MLTALLALASACFAAAPPVQNSAPHGTPQEQTTPQPAAAALAPQGPAKVCLDAQTADKLTQAFADRLRKTIAASSALSLASTTDACSLQLHVPGNLLRFETAGGVMVSTVVIVTSPSGRYLSTSITACRAGDLKPCAVRAVTVAKLALLVGSTGGT